METPDVGDRSNGIGSSGSFRRPQGSLLSPRTGSRSHGKTPHGRFRWKDFSDRRVLLRTPSHSTTLPVGDSNRQTRLPGRRCR